jgi:tRNA dimethylallyltransferase
VLHEIGAQSLWNQLNAEDPASAALIHPNNSKRVIRAFELLADGTSYAEQNAKLKHIPQVLPATFIVLQVERDALNRRIDQRVDTMFEEGLIEEVEGLLANGLRDAITAPQAIGYKEVVDALEGRCSMDEARQQVKQASHRYAKRQRSWFRADARAIWVDANPTAGLASRALRAIAGNAHHLTPPA